MTSKFRKSLRLPDFDYSQEGAYFVTIVTEHRACLFGDIVEEQMILNGAGNMIDQVCREVSENIPGMFLDDYQIMPNHFHGIIMIDHSVGADLRVCPGRPQRVAPIAGNISLSNFVQRFKSLTTYRYIQGVKKNCWPRLDRRLWQRNYYEHIIRNIGEHQAIVDYIFCNPQNWEKDAEHPY